MHSESLEEDYQRPLPVSTAFLASRFNQNEPAPAYHAEEDLVLPEDEDVADKGGPTEPEIPLSDRLWTTKLAAWPGREEEERIDENDESTERAALVYSTDQLRQGVGSKLRVNALFITSTLLNAMDTSSVLRLLSSSLAPPHPLGIEWVDDENVVAPFSRALDAEKAFFNLTAHPLDPTAPLEFHLISAITHESLTELNLTSEAPKPFFVRLAMASDVRAVDAAKKSTFYSKQREERLARTPYSRSEGVRRQGHDLDAELDDYASARDGKSTPSRSSKSNRTTKQSLDDELDAFLRGE